MIESVSATASLEVLIVFAVGVYVGLCAPSHYAMERLQGFARSLLGKLPYQPPPGMDEEEALEEATDE